MKGRMYALILSLVLTAVIAQTANAYPTSTTSFTSVIVNGGTPGEYTVSTFTVTEINEGVCTRTVTQTITYKANVPKGSNAKECGYTRNADTTLGNCDEGGEKYWTEITYTEPC